MTIFYFILGGIYTVTLILIGAYIGYTLKEQKIQKPEIIERITKRFKKDEVAGPVKPITRKEREAEDQKGFTDRIKELTTD